MEDFMSAARYYLKSDKKDWVNASLENTPKQQRFTFEQFNEMIMQLSLLKWKVILERSKPTFLNSPLIEWRDLMSKLFENSSNVSID